MHQEVEKRLVELLSLQAPAITVSSFITAILMAGQADLLLVVPSLAASSVSQRSALKILSVPSLALPSFEVTLYWHERMDRDPGHRWLRSVIADLARSLPGQQQVVAARAE